MDSNPDVAASFPNASDAAVRLRILDANANRAAEGLRVAEEYARFVLDDSHLATLCKELRHDLTAALKQVASAHLYAARDTQADVGTAITVEGERSRGTAWDVAHAGLKRAEQALRCIEEYAKGLSDSLSVQIESLRYRGYTLAKAFATTVDATSRLANRKLYVLVDEGPDVATFRARAEAVVAAGAQIVQLRIKTLPDREILRRAKVLRDITRGHDALLIVNDRPDLALLSRADGVHVGQDELGVSEARRVLGPGRIVGVSTHDLAQARKAVLDGADYLGCGPTFPSGTKTFEQFPGLDFLRAVSGEIRLPAFAIGGIDPENIGQVMAAGMTRAAVSGAIWRAADPAAVTKCLAAMLGSACLARASGYSAGDEELGGG